MGWSQGGYISAFITCYSDRFKAVSVGAGNLELDHILREHGHSPFHPPVFESDPLGRSRNLSQDIPHHVT